MDQGHAHGWTAAIQDTPDAYRLPYTADRRAFAARIQHALSEGPGFALVTGTPVADGTPAKAQGFARALLAPLGTLLPQGRGKDREEAWLVRDEGISAHTGEERFHQDAYTSKSRGYLHLHNDRAVEPFGHQPDLVALLVHRAAVAGGASVLVDGYTVHAALARAYPRELRALGVPFPFDRRHVTPAGMPPVVHAPILHTRDGRLRIRCNTKRNETAVDLTGRPLTTLQTAALTALKEVLARPDLRITLPLREGDCLVIDDRRILHGRTDYRDHTDPARRRCLVRAMIALRT